MNLSDRQLSEKEEEVLRLGLKFTPALAKILHAGVASAVEDAVKKLKLSDEDASDLRGKICGVMKRSKPPQRNLSRDHLKAIRDLKQDEDICILPADKGECDCSDEED